MSDKNAESHDGEGANDVDPWVQSQLSADHLHWLEKQRDAVGPTETLKFALAEWVVRHPDDWFGDPKEIPTGSFYRTPSFGP